MRRIKIIMKKSLLVLPALMLLLAACTPPAGSSTSTPDPTSTQPTPTSSEPAPTSSSSSSQQGTAVLLAKYDLSDQVRTAYVAGTKSKFDPGEFAPFLKGQIVSGGVEKLDTSSGETNLYTAANSYAATGPQYNGIKMGGSQKDGTVTLNFVAGAQISKIVVGAAGWPEPGVTPDTLTIGGVTLTPEETGVNAEPEEMVFEFAATNVVTITSHYRIIFSYISVYGVL